MLSLSFLLYFCLVAQRFVGGLGQGPNLVGNQVRTAFTGQKALAVEMVGRGADLVGVVGIEAATDHRTGDRGQVGKLGFGELDAERFGNLFYLSQNELLVEMLPGFALCGMLPICHSDSFRYLSCLVCLIDYFGLAIKTVLVWCRGNQASGAFGRCVAYGARVLESDACGRL